MHSLIRDGRELAEVVRQESEKAGSDSQDLDRIIKPYIQFVKGDETCQWTGMKLTDIWRYFRYTWLTPARSTPGRTMQIIIRDASVEPHPVIGIAALSSSIVQQTERDEWIGWTGDKVLEMLCAGPTDALARWLYERLEEAVKGIYVRDFLEEGVIDIEDISMPSQLSIDNLLEREIEYKDLHRTATRAEIRQQNNGSEEWDDLARTYLFKGKRAGTLAKLLQIRQDFKESGFGFPGSDSLARALENPQFRHAVRKLVRLIKASRVGISMMDISVAGSIAPYNELLGGKLVSMLLCSREVRDEYQRRYERSPSIIASSMRGQAVYREPRLVLLCTTGLFGNGSTQYNRISIPSGAESDPVRFKKLDCVTQYGTFHFSDATIYEMKRFSETVYHGTDVRGIFGEGVNPRMRKIRQSLDRLGFPSSDLLQHSTPRSVYVVALASNFREFLLGVDSEPSYLSNLAPEEDTRRIVEFWRHRWLEPRIRRDDVIEAVASHRLTGQNHAALVILPPSGDETGGLFEEGNVDYAYDWDV
ncbi:MAG: DUF4338 domain-containing protein [Armatimonadetes bacterium]|nr:DUF4338 domain-containing protein [Armatimonadota bacterium]